MKKALKQEIDNNFQRYRQRWPRQQTAALTALNGERSVFVSSYRRLTSLQAWRTNVIDTINPNVCASFFLEAQNDAMYSHILAQMGVWRLALQSLRSCLENCCLYLYYKDHLVEFQQWEGGAHRLSFRDLKKYFRSHPLLVDTPNRINGIDQLSAQFDVLSKAVHGSALDLRMTAGDKFPNLWDTTKSNLTRWATNEQKTIETINLLLVAFYREMISGVMHPQLRDVVGYSIVPSKRGDIKATFNVILSA